MCPRYAEWYNACRPRPGLRVPQADAPASPVEAVPASGGSLKSPSHHRASSTRCSPSIPDARIVFTHRDPAEACIPSVASDPVLDGPSSAPTQVDRRRRWLGWFTGETCALPPRRHDGGSASPVACRRAQCFDLRYAELMKRSRSTALAGRLRLTSGSTHPDRGPRVPCATTSRTSPRASHGQLTSTNSRTPGLDLDEERAALRRTITRSYGVAQESLKRGLSRSEERHDGR